MVPVRDIIESPLAEIQTAARQQLGQPIDWPDLAAGVAIRIGQRNDIPFPESWLTDVRQSEPPDFCLAPVVAAYGFVLNMAAPNVRDAWVASIEALRGRAQFPGDRDSFEYSPRELAGIACGIAILDDDPDGHIAWFSDLLRRGLASGHFNSPQLQLAALMTLNHVAPSTARAVAIDPPSLDSLSMRELTLVAQLSLATGSEDVLPTIALEAAFRKRHAEEPVRINDVGEAAALWCLCKRILDSLAFRDPSASFLDTILALCRRFHLFVMQLGRRHDRRATLSVRDEYDVQDLLHAILLLHFDDVRPEEVTPSYAGNSSRVDFYLPDARIVVEVKMTRDSLRQRRVVDQLIEDSSRYASMKDVDTLVCLVYDPGNYCHNPTALEHDVAESGGRLSVHAVVCPRGV